MKKGQTLIISFAALTIILIIFFQLFVREYQAITIEENKFKMLRENAARIGNMLASPPSPLTADLGDPETIQKIGLVKQNKISNDTMNEYARLPYLRTKVMLGTAYDYLYYFNDESNVVKVGNNNYWGWSPTALPEFNGGNDFVTIRNNITSKYLTKIERYVQLGSYIGPVKLTVYVWTS